MKESEAIAERWGNIAERHLVMVHTFKEKQHKRKCDLDCAIMGLKRKIKEMQKVLAGDIAFQSHVQEACCSIISHAVSSKWKSVIR